MDVKAEVSTRVPEGMTTIEVRDGVRRQRLIRALARMETLEEFLVDPEGVAEQFEVELTEREVAAVQRAAEFLSEWDRTCGDGRWLETAATREDARRRARTMTSLEDAVALTVRDRIAEEILEDVPEAIRRTSDRFGAEALVRPGRDPEELPPHVRPLRRVVRGITERVTRDLELELNQLAIHGLTLRRRGPFAYDPAERERMGPPYEPEAREIPLDDLRRHLVAVATRAIEDSIERVRASRRDRLEPLEGRLERERYRI